MSGIRDGLHVCWKPAATAWFAAMLYVFLLGLSQESSASAIFNGVSLGMPYSGLGDASLVNSENDVKFYTRAEKSWNYQGIALFDARYGVVDGKVVEIRLLSRPESVSEGRICHQSTLFHKTFSVLDRQFGRRNQLETSDPRYAACRKGVHHCWIYEYEVAPDGSESSRGLKVAVEVLMFNQEQSACAVRIRFLPGMTQAQQKSRIEFQEEMMNEMYK